jgi:anhydro-N-acetylmuramic acid kinase
MSGTSLDGLDICFVRFVKGYSWSFEIIKAETVLYSDILHHQLNHAIDLPAEQLLGLHS